MKGTAAVVPVLAAALLTSEVRADNGFSGDEAAYVDWSVRNCDVASTDKEHRLVDEANAKDAAGFLRKYESKFRAKDLSGALEAPSKQEHMCADIKGWFGPLGSRIPDLIKWEGTSTAGTSDKPAASTATGRKGRRRSAQ
jgi:hypothetical protein